MRVVERIAIIQYGFCNNSAIYVASRNVTQHEVKVLKTISHVVASRGARRKQTDAALISIMNMGEPGGRPLVF